MEQKYYKAFDKDLKCRGFQYQIGQKYKIDVTIKICENGFHSCENPLDILNYYDLTNSRFCEVLISGQIEKDSKLDSKVCSSEIEILKELSLQEFIQIAVQYNQNLDSKLAASGDSSNLAANGNYSNLAANGNYSNLAASGESSKLAANGDGSNLAANGYGSKLAANGYGSNLAANGYGSNLAANGNCSKLAANGENSIVMSAGENSYAKAGKNGMIVLTYYDENAKRYRVKVGYIGEDLKPDTWYKLDSSGNFIE